MRNKSKLSKKIMFYLKKAIDLFDRGRLRALVVEVNGVRYLGKDMKEVKLDEKQLSFVKDQKKVELPLSKLMRFRRLRTKKYLFVFNLKASDSEKQYSKDESDLEPVKEDEEESEDDLEDQDQDEDDI